MDETHYLLIAILVIVVLLLLKRASNSGDAARLARVERKLDVILKQLGIDESADVDPRVRELVQSGQKIAAIKLYREQTGVGLKEAKDYVDGL